jgi:hypothetical protein
MAKDIIEGASQGIKMAVTNEAGAPKPRLVQRRPQTHTPIPTIRSELFVVHSFLPAQVTITMMKIPSLLVLGAVSISAGCAVGVTMDNY